MSCARLLRCLILALGLLAGLGRAGAAPAIVALPAAEEALGLHAGYLQETETQLALEQAMALHGAGRFTAGASPVLSFGIGAPPTWLHLSVSNPDPTPRLQRLLIENPWLDEVDAYFVRGQQTVARSRVGDSLPFSTRPLRQRLFALDHAFAPGTTDIYLRVAAPDPMDLPVYLLSPQAAGQRELAQGYSYGFLYGYLLALLAYNLLIYRGLRDRRHLLYAGFVAVFVLLNVSYTGHGFAWLWPGQVTVQRWIIPTLMVLYSWTGLHFATNFLGTASHMPRLHGRLTGAGRLALAGLLATYLAPDQRPALLWAFSIVTLFSLTMLALGLAAYRARYPYAGYFLLASVTSMLGTMVTALSVWGWLPFSEWRFRAVEIGMLVDATLLALALGGRLRSIQRERAHAEQRAARDPLTGLLNRRSLLEMAQSVWNKARYGTQDLSLIMLDLDNFKRLNDCHGHAAGDAALVAAGQVLHRAVRHGDGVARWGGEEFLLLLPDTKLEAAIALAERLRQDIAAIRLPAGDGELGFTASFGIACKAEEDSLDRLITTADNFLYQAKKGGRNRIRSALGDT